MIIEQTLKTVTAGAAVAAAVIVSVVAAAFTVFALVSPLIGPAGASAVVAALFAAVAGLVALIATRRAAPKRADASTCGPSGWRDWTSTAPTWWSGPAR